MPGPLGGFFEAVGILRKLGWRREPSDSVGAAVSRFAISGIAAMLIVGGVSIAVLRHTGTSEAIRNAREVTRLAGEGIVEPQLSDGLLRGDPAARARVDRVVRRSVLREPVVRVKIWAPDGRIVYSDRRRLVGQRYTLGSDEMETLAHGGSDAEVSDLSRPENRFERGYKKLLEVYAPIHAPDGRPLLFETYLRFSSVSASGSRLLGAFLPAVLGALLLLLLVQLPAAWSMARRLRQGRRDREALLRKAIASSETERRRIAQDLHDGVVQSLAGVSYALSAAADRAEREGASDDVPATLRTAAGDTRQSIRELRNLLVEIYPPSLHRAGLEAALRDLIAPLEARGVTTSLRVAPERALPPEVEALFFRTAQEAIRNAIKHAEPSRLDVSVTTSDGCGRLVVRDDGRGFEPARNGDEGHFGMRILEDLSRDLDADLSVESSPGEGTEVRVEANLP